MNIGRSENSRGGWNLEQFAANHLRLFLVMALGIIVFVGIIAVAVFFLSVQGAEQTMVPDVRGMDLTGALLELQVKELYPRIQLRYTQSSKDKGLILEQEPAPGTIVKAGRRIRLVVSQGMMINTVKSYLGVDIGEARMDIQAINAGSGTALLSIQEPTMLEFSSQAPGVILQQKPPAGSPVSGPTVLEFVVSRGPEIVYAHVPDLRGLSVPEALEELRQAALGFSFTLRPAFEGEPGEIILAQDPPAETQAPEGTTVSLTVAEPVDLAPGETAGLFRFYLAPNPYPLGIRLEALLPTGERVLLLAMDHPGGEITMPYRLPEGTILILSMLNRELYRETVGEQ